MPIWGTTKAIQSKCCDCICLCHSADKAGVNWTCLRVVGILIWISQASLAAAIEAAALQIDGPLTDHGNSGSSSSRRGLHAATCGRDDGGPAAVAQRKALTPIKKGSTTPAPGSTIVTEAAQQPGNLVSYSYSIARLRSPKHRKKDPAYLNKLYEARRRFAEQSAAGGGSSSSSGTAGAVAPAAGGSGAVQQQLTAASNGGQVGSSSYATLQSIASPDSVSTASVCPSDPAFSEMSYSR